MRTDFLDYHLPPELIAQEPCPERDKSRLLVVRRSTQSIEHRIFEELPELLNSGDLLVLNDTRVVPARLVGSRSLTGGRWEGLFLRELPDASWEILSKSRGKLTPGEEIQVEPGPLRLKLVKKTGEGHWLVQPEEVFSRGTWPAGQAPRLNEKPSALRLLEQFGHVPLPPYIRKGQAAPLDRDRYQTVYARQAGAVAAPTAGFHFTSRVFELLQKRGISWTFVTLHVGLGTFLPIQHDDVTRHVMHREWGDLSSESAKAINECRARGGKIIAVGTTSARLLETVAAVVARSPDRATSDPIQSNDQESMPQNIGRGEGGEVSFLPPWQGETDLYILPPFPFRVVDALVTNFHLPKTTLLLLVGAFGGIDLIKRAYETAIEERYRFFSYGDAMVIL